MLWQTSISKAALLRTSLALRLIASASCCRARYKEDKSNIMTSIFKEAKPGHHLQSTESGVTLALDPGSGRLLSFQRTHTANRARFPLVLCMMRWGDPA